MEPNWKEQCEYMLFDLGKHLLGKNAGGMIVKLKEKKGIRNAWTALMQAIGKQDPREYIGAALRDEVEKISKYTEAEISESMERYRQRRLREGWL